MSLVRFKPQNHPQQATRDDVDDRATTPEVFGPLNDEFRFTVDVAAAPHNTKVARFYTREDDGLAQSWAGERVWCNPPYSSIGPWVAKAWAETACPVIVMLLPANRTEQRWWQDHVEPLRDRPGSPLRTRFLPGRMRFLRPGQDVIGPNERPPFGVLLAIWERDVPAIDDQRTGVCPVCRTEHCLTVDGRLWTHGPRNARCRGSRLRLDAARYAARDVRGRTRDGPALVVDVVPTL